MFSKRIIAAICIFSLIFGCVGMVGSSAATVSDWPYEDDFEGNSSSLSGGNGTVVADEDGTNHYLKFYRKTDENYTGTKFDYGSSGTVYVDSLPLHTSVTLDIYQEADNTEPFIFEYYADDFNGDGKSDACGGATIAKGDIPVGIWYTLSLKKISGTGTSGIFKATLTNKVSGASKMIVPTFNHNVSANTTYNRFLLRSRNVAGSTAHWCIDNIRVEENTDFELPSRIVTVDADYPVRKVENKGLVWTFIDHVKGTVDDKTTDSKGDDEIIDAEVTETAYVDSEGNIVATTINNKPLKTNTPYGVYLYSADNNQTDNPFNPSRFTKSNDFETRLRFDDYFYLMYYTGTHRFYLLFNSDSAIAYNDKNNESRMIEADIGYGKWIDLKLSVRDQKWGTIYIDGKEIISYELPETTARTPYIQYTVYKDDCVTNLEIDGATITPVDTESLKIDSVSHNAVYDQGQSITLKTNLSTEDVQATYYINGIKVGTDKLTTSTSSESGGGCNGQETTTTTTTNEGLEILDLKKGVYDIVAECNGVKNLPIRIFVGIEADGAENVASNGEREYILEYEYDGTSANNVVVNDGYFTLDFSHGKNKVNYRSLNNNDTKYIGDENGIGAGRYKAVVTSGYAEVYYNDQFLFSTFLPYTYNESSKASFVYSGVTNVKKNPSGVKKERYHMDWDGRTELADYGMSFERFYSVEFDKLDYSDDAVTVYDGEYQAKLTFDERGITAESQPNDYDVTSEFRLADSFEPGYYRLTVAKGLAQLFRNNEFIRSFKCPAVNHKNAVFRKVENPDGTTFIAVKNTDDIYFHNEDFENNGELAPLNYWASERESTVLAEGETDPFTQELITQGENTYLKISDVGLSEYIVPETSLDADPVGDFNLNVTADAPIFRWKAKADGKGAVHFLGRHTQRGVFLSFGYDFDTAQWILAQHDRMSGEGKYYDGRTILATAEGDLDTNWHNYELIMNEGDVALVCDGSTVLSYSGLENTHGKLGFGVSKGASLSVDDIVYSGEGKVSAGFSYFSISAFGSKDFFYSPKHEGVVAASTGTNSFVTKDGGKTWTHVAESSANTSLNLLSGGFMMVGYGSSGWNLHRTYSAYYPEKALEYWGNGNRMINGVWGKSNLLIEPDWYDDMGYGRSIMPSRLVQVQDGKYKGRIFFSRDVGNTETYGRPVLFYTDADNEYDPNNTIYYDGLSNKNSSSVYYPVEWTQSTTSFFCDVTGINSQEPLTVDMPNDVIRFFVRNDCGFLYYADSFDGGDTFGEMQPSQLIAPLCCYGIMRDPDNLNHYYAYFEYEANTSEKSKDGGRPRTRGALTVSYDGMKNWHYVMDIEELTDNWRTSNTPMNHGMRVIDGTVYMSYAASRNYAKLFSVDISKIKPLLRFSEVHDKNDVYTNVQKKAVTENCIIPKDGGNGKIYGENTEINVENGRYHKSVIEAVFGVTEKSFGVFDFCGVEVTIPADENGYYSIKDAAKLFSKNLAETEVAYIISSSDLTRVNIYQFENMSVEKSYEQEMKSVFLNSLNVATQFGDSEEVQRHITENKGYLTAQVDGFDVERLLGTTFYDISDIDGVMNDMSAVGCVYISTVGNCFDGWTTIASDNALTVEKGGNLAIVENNGYYASGNSFGVSAPLPDEGYTVEFAVKPEAKSDTTVHFGNGNNKIKLTLVADDQPFDDKSISIPSEVWTTVKLLVSGGAVSAEYIVDGEESRSMTLTSDTEASDSGLWFDVEKGKLSLKDVRVYSGESKYINFGTVCQEVDTVAIPTYASANNLTRVTYIQNPTAPNEGEPSYMVTTFDARNSVKGMPLAVHISGGAGETESANYVQTLSIFSTDEIFDEWYTYKVVGKQTYGIRDMKTVAVYRKKAGSTDPFEKITFLENNGGRISSGIGNIRFGYRTGDERYAYSGATLSDTVWEVSNVRVVDGDISGFGYVTNDGKNITLELEITAPDDVAEPIIAVYDGGRFVACDSKNLKNDNGNVLISVPVEGLKEPEIKLFVWKSLTQGVSHTKPVMNLY